jgi:hypothetical protein
MRYLRLMLFLLMLWAPRWGWATAQMPDLLVYQGDTLLLQANPLEQWLDQLPERPAEFSSASATNCWRGYQAIWQLENEQLYLVRIVCCAPNPPLSTDLRHWFVPNAKGWVAATWVTGRLVVAIGKLLHYEHIGYESIYEQDWVLTFQQGHLAQQQTFDNQSCLSLDLQSSQAFMTRLYRAVVWRRVPTQHGRTRPLVIVRFQPDSTGHSSQVTLVKPAGWPYDSLAMAAARTMVTAEWGACYRFNRWQARPWYVPIHFDKATRQRYQVGARHQ